MRKSLFTQLCSRLLVPIMICAVPCNLYSTVDPNSCADRYLQCKVQAGVKSLTCIQSVMEVAMRQCLSVAAIAAIYEEAELDDPFVTNVYGLLITLNCGSFLGGLAYCNEQYRAEIRNCEQDFEDCGGGNLPEEEFINVEHIVNVDEIIRALEINYKDFLSLYEFFGPEVVGECLNAGDLGYFIDSIAERAYCEESLDGAAVIAEKINDSGFYEKGR